MADETIPNSLPKSREEAKARGAKRYFTGSSCKNGHVAERYTSIGMCVMCAKAHHYQRMTDPEIVRRMRTNAKIRMAGRRADPIENEKVKAERSKSQKRHWKKDRANFFARLAESSKPTACEVCGPSKRRIVFDHCHATGKFRGWICHQCNLVLGLVNDDPQILQGLITYLGKNLDDHAVLPNYLRSELE